jgi:hypothetical protein
MKDDSGDECTKTEESLERTWCPPLPSVVILRPIGTHCIQSPARTFRRLIIQPVRVSHVLTIPSWWGVAMYSPLVDFITTHSYRYIEVFDGECLSRERDLLLHSAIRRSSLILDQNLTRVDPKSNYTARTVKSGQWCSQHQWYRPLAAVAMKGRMEGIGPLLITRVRNTYISDAYKQYISSRS